jgi:protein associated with RNAse G/E
MRDVRAVYRKFDGSLHWHQWLKYLGEDEFGVWLGAQTGGVSQRGSELTLTQEQAHVQLFPREKWFTAMFNDPPRSTEIYVDVTTPPEFPADDLVTMIDLDLDVIRKRDGTVIIDDEDEFAEHQVKYGYPRDVIEKAQATCDWLVGAVANEEPFLTVYKGYLDKIR